MRRIACAFDSGDGAGMVSELVGDADQQEPVVAFVRCHHRGVGDGLARVSVLDERRARATMVGAAVYELWRECDCCVFATDAAVAFHEYVPGDQSRGRGEDWNPPIPRER